MDNWVPGAAERTYVGQNAYIDGATPSSGTYTYLTHDHLGSVRAGWSGGKAQLASNEFMAYGETRVESGQRIDLGYTGHKWDAETKQYFAPYRYYSPGSSRWMSRDPLGFVDGPNVYGYVGGNPIRYVDPLGLNIADIICGNIKEAEDHAFRPFWFKDKVQNRGPWDYKQLDTNSAILQHFGNWHYGVVGAAAGYPRGFLLRQAGRAQKRDNTSNINFGKLAWFGTLGGTPPYGDDPVDQYHINRGYDAYRNTRKWCENLGKI